MERYLIKKSWARKVEGHVLEESWGLRAIKKLRYKKKNALIKITF